MSLVQTWQLTPDRISLCLRPVPGRVTLSQQLRVLRWLQAQRVRAAVTAPSRLPARAEAAAETNDPNRYFRCAPFESSNNG